MFTKPLLLASSLILCLTLVACDEDNKTTQSTNTATEEHAVATAVVEETKIATQEIKAGMSEKAVTELLGEPTILQTRTLDTLMITHSEWTNDAGTTSVQFLNGVVQYHQFTPATK